MRLPKKLGIASVGIAIGLAGVGLPSAAQALQFNFSYTAGGNTASGILTTTSSTTNVGGVNYYTITGITGTRNGSAIDGLVSYNGNNNLFSPTAPYLTGSGFSYSIFGGGVNFNVTSTTETNSFGGSLPISSFTANSVPEPSDIGGLAILIGMGGLMVRKFKTSQKPTTFIAETKEKTLVS